MKTILIVDDDRYLRLLMEEAFGEAGFNVVGAANGEEGLDLLQQVHPNVVLLDQNMPKMGGSEFLVIKGTIADVAAIPVIVVSAVPDRTAALGAVAFVPKPFDFDRLLEEVERFCKNAG